MSQFGIEVFLSLFCLMIWNFLLKIFKDVFFANISARQFVMFLLSSTRCLERLLLKKIFFTIFQVFLAFALILIFAM